MQRYLDTGIIMKTFMAPALYLTLGHESGVNPSKMKMTSSRQKSTDICYMLFFFYNIAVNILAFLPVQIL